MFAIWHVPKNVRTVLGGASLVSRTRMHGNTNEGGSTSPGAEVRLAPRLVAARLNGVNARSAWILTR